ncbi:SusC/RagA family TonB-linked outer membrane protein [Foetidibacter luteolus]|uniref:SusC/RagA family TonB-linked outer membrane protein n=1 Tax=Foetidibacter luteolus TaxID=2608880 RepID=UPI00129BE005|nr:SusC/RagA family TonB-linked outer membrane protein [Foetidibacter luteolus]
MKIKLLLRGIVIPLVSFLLISSTTLAQSKKVTGKVVSATQVALAGVSVQIKGASTGTVTDASGSYSLTVPGNSSVLVFTFIGFATKEVEVGTQSVIDVQLSESSEQLSDVVVVGYGTQKKKEITSAITSVNAEQFNKGNTPDVAQLLQGKVAGLSISKTGGDPNGGFAIRLRGLSTLGANSSPLVVVDGQIGININTVDPNDIQTMDVLKDAASAAIYGTRGSAGVIIITTKRGAKGASLVSYNGSVTSEKAVKFTPHMDAKEYVAAGGTDYGANTDWNKEISRNAISHTHNLSLSGGSGGTSYSASVNYRDNQGIAITTGFQQLNGRFSLQQKALKDKLVFNLDMTTTKRNAQFGWSDAFKYATIFNPTAPVRSDDPLYDKTGGGYFEQDFVDYSNPVAVLEQNVNSRITKRNNLNALVTYEVIRGLKFAVRYAQENNSEYNWAYLSKRSFYVRSFLGVSGFARNGFAWKRDDENFNQLYENTLAYDTKISDIKVSAIAGYSYQDFQNKGFLVQAGNFISDAAGEDFNSSLDFKDGKAFSDSYKNGSRLIAFFGRLNLNYNDFAYISASLRREGSTQFGVNNKWGMFPAVSGGLDIGRLVDIANVNSLKFRASYGITGALPGGSYYSQQLVGPTGNLFYYNGSYVSAYEPSQNANPDLKWERKSEFDVGLDFALFSNRLTGTIDYYNRKTSDLIFNAFVPVPPFPTNRQYQNIGVMESNGFEFLLGYDVLKGSGLEWNTSANFSTYNVKLASLNKDLAGSYVGATNLGTPGQEQTEITRAMEGEKIGILWGAVYRGLNKEGRYLFDDGNGDTTRSDAYKTIIGNGLPDFELGWSNTFRYKNFDFNFFLRGAFGHQLVNTYRGFYENGTPSVVNNYNVVKTKYFNPGLNDQQIFSSLFVEKASFIKLDNATIGYNFNLSSRGAIKSLRAFITGQNLFVITDYTGVDPEVRYSDGTNILAPGVDRRETWVRTRAFTLGVNLQF